MLTESHAVLASVLLTWIMILTASTLRAKMWTPSGLSYSFGNRERTLDVTPAAARSDRAAKNMLENMVLFLGVVVGARLLHHGTGDAALGANVFLGARVLYFPLYLAGVPYVRTLAWAVALVGIALVAMTAL